MAKQTDRRADIIRLLLVEDHSVIREPLRDFLNARPGLSVVGEASTLTQALDLMKNVNADIMLLDICLHGEDGLDVLAEGRKLKPELKYLVLSAITEYDFVLKAIRHNAEGFLPKHCSSLKLEQTIRDIAQGRTVWEPDILSCLAKTGSCDKTNIPPSTDELTPIEQKIARLIAEGFSNREIGHLLNNSEKTIRNRITNIFDKLHLKRRTQIARLFAASQESLAERKYLSLNRLSPSITGK